MLCWFFRGHLAGEGVGYVLEQGTVLVSHLVPIPAGINKRVPALDGAAVPAFPGTARALRLPFVSTNSSALPKTD